MPSDTRLRMVEGAALLLAKRGLQETSFSEVLELTGTPRGSIYHHFPDGKDQLVASALELAGERANAHMASKAGSTPLEITEHFLYLWREVLTRSKFSAGCSVLAVTVATDSPALLQDAANVFRTWRATLAALFGQGGMPAEEASAFATTLIAATEGAVVLARAEQSLAPFEEVATYLLRTIAECGQSSPPRSL